MKIFSLETARRKDLTFPFCIAGGGVAMRRAAMMDDGMDSAGVEDKELFKWSLLEWPRISSRSFWSSALPARMKRPFY